MTLHARSYGFTLIELLVVLAILGVLAGLAVPRYIDRVDQAREVALKHDLTAMRTAIDQFARDKGKYPDTLQDLVDARYIYRIPTDPITDRVDTWQVVAPLAGASSAAATSGKVFDVHSGATGQGGDGTPFALW
jgi:general secretion pathway protein G